ncbi:IS21 family transposase [Polyangium aurulentum]|uniref:IS21 family transposase n=1 Tax=Polyangium aurulentum TaxID=2567896 RepID=UPI0010AE031C|nr:IS21 family transposase [Polyangium aurulentum]UQA63579.1 IS21 family transposase [Polyangium aurulentum]UQA63664.1 IS21 family transposase [Polyangium aurulentum]UQA63931.1 IS21 family transposase [Polyangium aurulentum]UQA63933.1 IS21 family transposase [Polyangium aurulentum]
MVEPEIIRQIRDLAARGWGAKRIARELEVARNTVKRYLRGGPEAEVQVRPGRRCLDDDGRAEARQLYAGLAGGNAVVVARELRQRGVEASVRTVQRVVADQRRERFAADAASVRFETDPGQQMQIDFGQKVVRIGGTPTRVHLLVAVLCHSRRLFVKAFLGERQDDWREGIAAAFRHFGGVPRTMLGDNARALVVSRDRETGTVTFHPAYVAFCRDWGVTPRACQPYRARTKGKTESGVKYVKRNGLAEREFASFAALEAHLAAWMVEADQRIHGTTHEPPIVRFERDERQALRPLPARPMPVREQRLRRRVANDALVDVDTIRYSVPHRLVRETVEVALGEHEVRIYRGAELVARHERSFEPYARIIDKAHYAGLWRTQSAPVATASPPSPLEAMGRRLSDYAAVLEEAAS